MIKFERMGMQRVSIMLEQYKIFFRNLLSAALAKNPSSGPYTLSPTIGAPSIDK